MPRITRSIPQVGVLALLVLAGELGFVALSSWSIIASVWELQWGSLWLAPSALLLLGVSLLACHALIVAALELKHGRYWATVCVVLFAATLTFGITEGRHFDVWWRRAGFIFVAALGSGWVAWRGTPWLRALSRERPLQLAWAALGLALMFEAANRWLLVRLYPALHLGWAALTLLALTLAWFVVRRHRDAQSPAEPQRYPWLWPAACAALAVLCGLGVLPALERFARFDNFRWVLSERAPLLGQVVRATSWLVPPAPLHSASADEPAAPAPNDAQRVSFADRDLLLITIDAARADHLGAYGYQRPTTPNIDALAHEGVRFEWAYTATPHTSYSLVSLLTGKYIRPLLLQGGGADSETLAGLLRGYGYRTAAFYPPAVFFIDPARFGAFENTGLGFEYQKREFLEGEARVAQVAEYLQSQPNEQRLFVWVHLFGPHEPYELHSDFDFGPRDIDRYDSELAAADRTVGQLVQKFRARSSQSVVIVSADHGEEFGEHGGRYHGSSVYEEQVRVPLVLSAPGALAPRVVKPPVQTIDILPSVLRALDIPIRPRIRGRDWSLLLTDPPAGAAPDLGFAYAETENQSMLAEGALRLVCERKIGACRLFNVERDPLQQQDIAPNNALDVQRLRARLQALNSSHGQFEQQGLRAEGQGWPGPILRGLAGDGDAAEAIAELLDDADVQIRRKASETLFRLHRQESAASLQLALQRDEDPQVKRYAALTLMRLGQGASLGVELLSDPDVRWRRRAALALGEIGDARGEDELIAWWLSAERDHEESLELLGAFQKLRPKQAVWALLRNLPDVRLRPHIAKTLAAIGDQQVRGVLARALSEEPYQTARSALARALVELEADTELVMPLRRWLAVPDPLEGGLGIVTDAGILEHVGGPDESDLRRLRENANLGELVRVIIPKTGNGRGLRVLVRGSNELSESASVWVGLPKGMFSYDSEGKLKKARKVPEIHPDQRVRIALAPSENKPGEPLGALEAHALIPDSFGWQPGQAVYLVVLAERGLRVQSLAVLPLQDELLPAPKGP